MFQKYSSKLISTSLQCFIVKNKQDIIGTRKDLLKQKNFENTSYGVWIIYEPANEASDRAKYLKDIHIHLESIINSKYFKEDNKSNEIYDTIGKNIVVCIKIESKENSKNTEPRQKLQLFSKQVVLSCTPSQPPGRGRGTGSKNFPVLPSPSKIKILCIVILEKKNSKTHMFLYKFDVSLSI